MDAENRLGCRIQIRTSLIEYNTEQGRFPLDSVIAPVYDFLLEDRCV